MQAKSVMYAMLHICINGLVVTYLIQNVHYTFFW